MAVSSDIAGFHPQLLQPFDGNILALPRHSFPFGAQFAASPFLQCAHGQLLVLASLPAGTIVATRWRLEVRGIVVDDAFGIR